MKEKYLEEQSRVDVDLPLHLKWKIGDEILQRLRRVNASANATEQLGECTFPFSCRAIVENIKEYMHE